jgi:SAM-dependent methyltransferase
MTSTYSKQAKICTKFYELTLDTNLVGEFVFSKSRVEAGQKALFVGGMFEIARFLANQGLDLRIIDYTEEMVEIGKEALPHLEISKADLRQLPFTNMFDYIFVVGRVFTHMISDEDLISALNSCHRSLKEGGRLFFDNYEDSKIQVTNYFNGTINCSDTNIKITRSSSTELISNKPFVVDWSATYTGIHEGQEFEFSDSMHHRAWSRNEILGYIDKTAFKILDQGNNFDETSFYNLAEKIQSTQID